MEMQNDHFPSVYRTEFLIVCCNKWDEMRL